MKHFLTVRIGLGVALLLALLLGACAPATDSAAYSGREPIYIASFEVPPALVESAEENCERQTKFLNATLTYMRDGLGADNLQMTTYCYESAARRRTIEGQFNRNAKAAGYISEGSSDNMDTYSERGKRNNLFVIYRPEGNMNYVTVAHVERTDTE